MVDNDPIKAFREAADAVERARRTVESLIAGIRAYATALNHWTMVVIDGAGVDFPNELVARSSFSAYHRLKASELPRVEQLAKAIVDYHAALEAARTAYRRIPHGLRTGLRRPA